MYSTLDRSKPDQCWFASVLYFGERIGSLNEQKKTEELLQIY